MKYEFEEDKYIIEALRMFGPLIPPQIGAKIKMREDIKDWIKEKISDQFHVQNRCLMMVKSNYIRESDIKSEPNDENGRWRYYK